MLKFVKLSLEWSGRFSTPYLLQLFCMIFELCQHDTQLSTSITLSPPQGIMIVFLFVFLVFCLAYGECTGTAVRLYD